MCQALGLYELRQYGATCVQAPRCHHTVIPQCIALTHSKKKNPLREKPLQRVIYHISYIIFECCGKMFFRSTSGVFLFEVCNNDSYVVRDMALA